MATTADDLWRRLTAALKARGVLPETEATAREIAKYADVMLDMDMVGRFVEDYYLPTRYGGRPKMTDDSATSLVTEIQALTDPAFRREAARPPSPRKTIRSEVQPRQRGPAQAGEAARQPTAQILDDGLEVSCLSTDGETISGVWRDDKGRLNVIRWYETGARETISVIDADNIHPTALSADGSVVVGWIETGDEEQQAFRWTESGGIEKIDLATGRGSEMLSVSSDGRVVVGSCMDGEGNVRLFRFAAAEETHVQTNEVEAPGTADDGDKKEDEDDADLEITKEAVPAGVVLIFILLSIAFLMALFFFR